MEQNKKMEILTRLIKEGHITLEEAFELSDRVHPNFIGAPLPYPVIGVPNIHTLPYRPGTTITPWFGTTHPSTGEPLTTTYTTTSTDSTRSFHN